MDQIKTKEVHKEKDKAETSIDSDRQSVLLAYREQSHSGPFSSIDSLQNTLVCSGGGKDNVLLFLLKYESTNTAKTMLYTEVQFYFQFYFFL